MGGRRIANPKAWTLCVVRREIARLERRENRRRLALLRSQHEPPAAAPGLSWHPNELARLFQVLTAREEEVLLLRVNGLKYREIASALGISLNSVKTLLARGLAKMRRAAEAPAPEDHVAVRPGVNRERQTLQ